MRCYLSHPNSVDPTTLAMWVATLEGEGWEVIDPTAYGDEMKTLKPWDWKYDQAFLLTVPGHAIGRGSFQDVVKFAGRGVPMEHLPTRHQVVAVRRVTQGSTWKRYGHVVLAGPDQEACSACLGSGEATGFVTGPCLVCEGTGLQQKAPDPPTGVV